MYDGLNILHESYIILHKILFSSSFPAHFTRFVMKQTGEFPFELRLKSFSPSLVFYIRD